ncbi:MAG: iron ABC transporter permease [Synergistaceae bacterium]|jgi:iron complex transport system permease protein|nr:iron ABC transporter permease [Synergistaceae bacterium]
MSGERGRKRLTNVFLVILPILTAVVVLGVGRYYVSVGNTVKILLSGVMDITPTWDDFSYLVVTQIRMPRVLLAICVGAALSASGASFQGVFSNPLTSPDILGVSSGAGFGAALGLLMMENFLLIQSTSLLFGLLSIVLVFILSMTKGRHSALMLILAGIVVGQFFQALVSFIKYVADPETKLPTITFWLMGSLATASYRDLAICGVVVAAASGLLLPLAWHINILSINEEEAETIGINVTRLRWLIITLATLMTAVTVAACGFIGWVGLVIPHVARMIVGADYRRILPASMSLGGTYLLIIDTVARTATAAEIPLSILTAVLGAPFFMYLLRKTKGGVIVDS